MLKNSLSRCILYSAEPHVMMTCQIAFGMPNIQFHQVSINFLVPRLVHKAYLPLNTAAAVPKHRQAFRTVCIVYVGKGKTGSTCRVAGLKLW